jgi:putative transposase
VHSLGKALRPARRREFVRWACDTYQVSEHRACRVYGFARSILRYRSVLPSEGALQRESTNWPACVLCYRYRCLHELLRREGWKNH